MLGKTTHDLLKGLSDKRTVRVIDLGCGPGTNVFNVYDACAEFAHVQWYGLDLNQREAALGADRSSYRVRERSMKPVHFLNGDIFHLPIADNSMDIVLSSEVVEHLPDPALREMQRVLKPGGYAMVTTPNPRNFMELMGYALDWVTGGWFKKNIGKIMIIFPRRRFQPRWVSDTYQSIRFLSGGNGWPMQGCRLSGRCVARCCSAARFLTGTDFFRASSLLTHGWTGYPVNSLQQPIWVCFAVKTAVETIKR